MKNPVDAIEKRGDRVPARSASTIEKAASFCERSMFDSLTSRL